jgi:hypothetical protein
MRVLCRSETIIDSGTTFAYLPLSTFRSVVALISSYCAAEGHCLGRRE